MKGKIKDLENCIKECKNLFSSIVCLRAEGVEFMPATQTLDSIVKEALKGVDICNIVK